MVRAPSNSKQLKKSLTPQNTLRPLSTISSCLSIVPSFPHFHPLRIPFLAPSALPSSPVTSHRSILFQNRELRRSSYKNSDPFKTNSAEEMGEHAKERFINMALQNKKGKPIAHTLSWMEQ
ncbi:hypothetical protein CFP56_042720 [Quercus suber]|uniref:Uncharacterized protein n=1 Tax=Quercus suber TaxID=58331 RepID=A0AAW0LJM8_QUESU